MVKYAINKSISDNDSNGGPLQKLLLALQLFNTYSDEPIVSREELLNIDYTASAKITKVTWPGAENIDEYFWMDE